MTKGKVLLLMAVMALSLLVLILIRGGIPSHYSYIPLLPFTSILVFVITRAKVGNQQMDVATALIFGMTFMRYCLMPLLMVYGDFNTVMKHHIEVNAPHAILLMMYEEIVVYFAFVLSSMRNKTGTVQIQKPRFGGGALFLLWFLLLYVTTFLVFRPQQMDNYMTIFSLGKEEFTQADRLETFEVGSVMRIFSTLFSFFFNILRIVLPVYILGWMMKKRASADMQVFFVLLFVFFQFLFISATFAESIISALIVILSIGKSSPKVKKKMMRIAPVFVIGIIVLYFSVRYMVSQTLGGGHYDGDTFYAYLSSLTNAYLTGIDNVAASFNLKGEDLNGIWEHFKASMQITIPFNTTIFGKAGESLPTYYNEINNEIGQIPSTLGNCYYYLGPVFAPLFSGLFCYYAVKLNAIASRTSYYWHYIAYTFLSVVCTLALGMYNEVIALGWFGSWGLPLLISAKIMDKK